VGGGTLLESVVHTNTIKKVKSFETEEVFAELPVRLGAGKYFARYTVFKKENIAQQGDIDLSILPYGTISNSGYGILGLSLGDKLILVGIGIAVLSLFVLGERMGWSHWVSGFLMDVVRNLPEGIGFLISKGGITSNDVLSKGLNLRASRVVGQILPGCSVVRCPGDHERFADLPVVIFPGNVGDEYSLARAYQRLALNKPGYSDVA